jgi:putative tricarboxylic transport membrane protein
MLDNLQMLGGQILDQATWQTGFNVLWAMLAGIIVGSMPGLTATLGVALMTSLTFSMEPNQAIQVLICVYVGAIYGGSRSAILLNIPGTPASAASTLDGFPLARQGLAGRAMGISTTGSWLGTLCGTLVMASLAPLLASFALSFGSYEFFWIAVFGIVISGTLAGGDPLKGYMAGFVGLLVSTIGQDAQHAYPRFAFGNSDLAGGIGLLPALVGAFGLAEVLTAMGRPRARGIITKIDSVFPRPRDVLQYWRTILRSGLIGTFTGTLPGLGEETAAFAAYAAAKRGSKEREKFGHGSIEGLMAAECGESACVPGAMIPVLTLAVPGSAPAAVLMAAMFIHGLNPGPMLLVTTPEYLYRVVAMLMIADMAKLFYGFFLVRPLLLILRVPHERLMPIVVVLCTIGAYATTTRVFNIHVMLVFGVLGMLLRRFRFPMAPLVLGMVLGELLDKNLLRGLTLSNGSLVPFFTRPICLALIALICCAIVFAIPGIGGLARGLFRRPRQQA